MTSLADAYEETVGEGADLRRLYLGVGMFLGGSLLVLVGIYFGTRSPGGTAALRDARWLAGVLGGLGVPAVFLGVFAVLPAARVTRAAAVVGAGVSVFGVSLFAHAYPCQWAGAPCGSPNLTLPTAAVYFLGVITTFWCLFAGVANVTTRDEPGGTVRLEVTRGGETKVIEVPREELDEDAGATGGGIGFFGDTPDGNVETQTNRPDARADDAAGSATDGRGVGGRPATGSGDVGVERIDGSGDASGRSASRPADDSGGRGGVDSVGTRGRSRTGGDSPSGSESTGDAGVDTVGSSSGRGGSPTGGPGSGGSPTGGSSGGFGSGRAGGDGAVGGADPSVSDGGATSESITGLTDDDPGSSTGGPSGPGGPGGPRGRGADDPAPDSPADSYCGSCAHFQYVRTEDGMEPYCGHHDVVMDDMDACSDWEPR
ncbi:hypothetical protein RYH80_06245 [Halobaculum sp. MBLA0147]|uniref:DUF7139 domain-containing protein n=1 Tax=Halobaculum sp. MBLA0147 TaxID=3079934 RepID=UPI003525EA88